MYNKEALTNYIIPLFGSIQEQTFGISIWLLFGIVIIKTCWNMGLAAFKGEDTQPERILLDVVIVVVAAGSLSVFFPIIKALTNYIADAISPADQVYDVIISIFKTNVLSSKITLFNFTGITLIEIFIVTCAYIVAIVVGFVHFLLLSIYFILGPIAIVNAVLSDISYVKTYFQDVIQIATWPIIMAGIFRIIQEFTGNSFAEGLGTMDMLAFLTCAGISILFVPMIASAFFGGTNYSPITFFSGLFMWNRTKQSVTNPASKWAGKKGVGLLMNRLDDVSKSLSEVFGDTKFDVDGISAPKADTNERSHFGWAGMMKD
jgi:hypothetical protein